MWRRELLRRFMTAMRPEEHFEEKIRTQTYTITEVPQNILESLEAICRKYGGTMPAVLPKPKETPTPVKPPAEIDPSIRKQIATKANLANPPPETIKSLDDFKALKKTEKIKLCTEILGDMKAIEEKILQDPELKKLYDFNLEQAKKTIAERKGKPVEQLTKREIREAEKKAKEDALLQLCGSRLASYFTYLSRPDILGLYLEPMPEKKPVEKITCTQHEVKWDNVRKAMTELCEKAREYIREKWIPFRWEVEAIYQKKKEETYRPFIHVIDEAYPNVNEPYRLPSHKITILMNIDVGIKVPKDKLKKAIDYLKTYRPSTLATIKTDKDLEREIILTLFKRIENRINDLLRHTCAPDIREEYSSLHPKQIKLFKEIHALVMTKYTGLPADMEEEEKWEKAYELAKKDLVKWTEELIITREEEVRKMFAELLATKTLEIAGRTLFEVLPVEPTCPPRVTIDIKRRKEKEVTLPSLATAGYRIVEELKTLEVEIEVEQLEIRIEFCTPWCSAIDCVLRNITPEYIMDEIVREAKRLGFVEVIIPYPSPSPG
jgi:hypothetical protein